MQLIYEYLPCIRKHGPVKIILKKVKTYKKRIGSF